MPRTNVIIPFFQRERGILPVAVRSALAEGGDDILVTIVDDGSPVRARDELASIMMHDRRVVLIEQANAGPGAARNRGLDATPDDVEYIAFLDSDDRWLPGHLANGMAALRAGADFYFCDFLFLQSNESKFVTLGSKAPKGIPIAGHSNLFFFAGLFFDEVMQGIPVATSTVIIRRHVAPTLRFPAGLRAGEDIYFWIGFGQIARRVAFSTCCGVVLGKGVNIYASVGWGSPEALRSVSDSARSWRMILKDFPLSDDQRERVDVTLAQHRREFATNFLHLLRRGRKIDLAVAGGYLAADPHLLGDLGSVFCGSFWRKLRAFAGGTTEA